MPKLPDFPITNFSGGLVKNKSDFELQINEFKNTLNLDLDEFGKAKRRRGIVQAGQTVSTPTWDESFVFTRAILGSASYQHHLVIDRASNGTLYRLVGTYNTSAIATADTTITIGSNADFSASGTLEINGDLIAYTAKSGTTSFTGVTGIRVAHAAFSHVRQLVSIGATGVDTRNGAYFSVLNNVLFINGQTGSATWNGSSFTDITDADEPAGLFATNYRDRIYVAGSGASDGLGTRNGDPRRVSFSNAGDSTTWELDDFFDVEDDSGEFVTGLKEGEDVLLIFKYNSIFVYDEASLRQTVREVGAYNHKVIQKINDVIYTFGPSGVYATNGFSAKKISDPIDKYLIGFKPQFLHTNGRVIGNTFAGKFEDKYYLYIGTITEPESLSDVVLIYDTIRNNWTIHSGYTNFVHFGSFKGFIDSDIDDTTAGNSIAQIGSCLFGGDTAGKYWRLFDGRFLDNGSTQTVRGSDYIPNLVSNNTGNEISTILETKFYDFGSPFRLKKLGALTVIMEQGDCHISYQLNMGDVKSNWISLGNFTAGITTKKFHQLHNECYGISLKITTNNLDIQNIINGIVVRDIELLDKMVYADF